LKRKRKSNTNGNLLIIFVLLLLIGLINGAAFIYEKIDNYFDKQKKQAALKEIEGSGFSNRLIPVSTLRELIIKEFPNVQLKEEKKGAYLSPASETYVFKSGKSDVTMGLLYFTEESYKGEFNGIINSVFLTFNYENIAFDSPLLKKLLKVISIGLSRNLSDEQINQFLKTASISKHSEIQINGINFIFSDSKPTKQYGKQPIGDISVSVINEEEALKVYELKK
jgi:uncharacterized protein YneF (UPF0154 family)